MEFNINAGRMVNPVELLSRQSGSDDYGQPNPLTVDFQAWADIDVKNGSQLVQMGETLTTELITCLMYYDDRVENSKWIRDVTADITYEIQHVRRSKRHQSMIITAKSTDFTESIEPAPTTRLAPNFNGVSQYAITQDMDMVAGDVLHFDIIAPTALSASDRMLICESSGFKSRVRVVPDGSIVVDFGTLTIDGVEASTIPLDGVKHKCAFTATQAIKVNLLAAQSNGAGVFLRFCDFPIFNVKLNDGSIYNFPMDDGWPNNPTMRNIGSGADGTFVNMTDTAWQEINL